MYINMLLPEVKMLCYVLCSAWPWTNSSVTDASWSVSAFVCFSVL